MNKCLVLATLASVLVGVATNGPAMAQNYTVGNSSGTYTNAPPPPPPPTPPQRPTSVAAVRG